MEEQKIEVRFNLSGPRRTSGSRVRKWPCVEVNKDFYLSDLRPLAGAAVPLTHVSMLLAKNCRYQPNGERTTGGGRERLFFPDISECRPHLKSRCMFVLQLKNQHFNMQQNKL